MQNILKALESAKAGSHLSLVAREPAVLPDPATAVVAVIGLGYVGLPLAAGFARQAPAIGFDISVGKIDDLNRGLDSTGEVTPEELAAADVCFTFDPAELRRADVLVVCVPTPVNAHYKPDYGPLYAASRTIGENIKRGAVVVFESTVDPGTTETRCLPILESVSGMKEGVDFYLGYSPERINPADPTRKLADIKKIVAGSSPVVADFLEALYGRVVKAGLCKAASIRVAEAAKILENTQRDVNIALMNEMMKLFDSMGIRTSDVVAAAGSKWNFHHYRPGLVGGHCIAVDPYFLVDAGRRYGLSMDLVAAARKVNEDTPYFLMEKLEELLARAPAPRPIAGGRVLVLGRSFKENCPDTRNSKAYRMMDAMWSAGADVYCHDPVADDAHFEGGRGAVMVDDPFAHGKFDALVVTLAHDVFRDRFDAEALLRLAVAQAPLLDLRGLYDRPEVTMRFTYWRP